MLSVQQHAYEVAGLLVAAIQNPNGDYGDLNFAAAISADSSRYPSMKLPASQGSLKDTMSVAGFAGGYSGSVTIYDQNPTIMGWSCGGMNANTHDLSKYFYDLLDESSHHPLVSAAARKEMTNIKELTAGYFKIPYGAGLMAADVSRSATTTGPVNKSPDDWGYLVGHIGETFAFHAINGYMPRAKAAISVVVNTDGGKHLPMAAACKATEIVAKATEGLALNLDCDSGSHSFGRRRRTTGQQKDAAMENTAVLV